MKKLLIIIILAGAFSNGYSQHFRAGGYARPRTTVVIGGGYYSPFYSPFAFGYPLYPAPYATARPSKLDQEIEDINHDYAEKIESTRMDASLTGKERRHEIRELKLARDRDIDLAKRDYHKQ